MLTAILPPRRLQSLTWEYEEEQTAEQYRDVYRYPLQQITHQSLKQAIYFFFLFLFCLVKNQIELPRKQDILRTVWQQFQKSYIVIAFHSTFGSLIFSNLYLQVGQNWPEG